MKCKRKNGFINAPIAQLDRAFDYGSKGCGFDSYWAHQKACEPGFGPALFLGASLYEYCDIAMCPASVLTTVDETVAAVAAICRDHQSEAWLFGSQARHEAHAGSDIDIAVRSDDFDAIEELVDEIDTVFLIDLVDLNVTHKKGLEDAWISIA